MLPGNTPALFGGGRPIGNDAYTVLLLHFDGTNNSTLYPDTSPKQHGNGVGGGASNCRLQDTTGLLGSPTSLLCPGNSIVTFPNSADWEFGAGDFTIDWWEYFVGGNWAIGRDFTTTYSPWLLDQNGIYFTSSGSGWDIASGRGAASRLTSTWCHMAITRQGNTFRVFRNGAQVDTWTSALAIAANNNPLCLGGAQNSYWNGYIEELRISKNIARWTAPFTPPAAPYGPDVVADRNTVLLMHHDGVGQTFVDSSIYQKPIGVNGGYKQVASPAKFGTGAAQWNGSQSDLLWIGGPTGNYDFSFGMGDFTIDFWFRFAAVSTCLLYDNRPGSTNGTYITFYVTTDKLAFYTNTANAIVGTTTLTANVWYHAALVRFQGVTKMYLNGVQEGASYSDTNNYLNPAQSRPIFANDGYSGSGNALNGWMDEVRVSKGIARWTANFTPPTAAYPDPPQPPGPKTIVLTTVGASAWTVPSDWTATNNIIECYGGGGGGSGNGRLAGCSGAGGGGGGYSKITNLSLTPGAIINIQIGGGGAGSSGDATAGGDTWFSSAATVLAKGGAGPFASDGVSAPAGGAGGQAGSGVGSTKFSGGSGGAGNSSDGWGPGGGGGAGPTSNGGNGTPWSTGGTAGTGGIAGAGGNGGTALNSDNATAGSIYGGGGGGSGFSSGAIFTGKAGAQGAIKISWG
jgi:hypothetical protein